MPVVIVALEGDGRARRLRLIVDEANLRDLSTRGLASRIDNRGEERRARERGRRLVTGDVACGDCRAREIDGLGAQGVGIHVEGGDSIVRDTCGLENSCGAVRADKFERKRILVDARNLAVGSLGIRYLYLDG